MRKKPCCCDCVCCWKRVVVDEMAASEGGSRRTTESEKNTEKSMKEMTKKPIKRIKVRGEEVVAYLSVTVVSKSENLLFPSSLSALGFLIAMILFITRFIATYTQQNSWSWREVLNFNHRVSE
ncbi:hypothetical protein QL285_094823 [Trifolium repens]|nr:hypothetical protein QL285_094823 [Trifolium repens]